MSSCLFNDFRWNTDPRFHFILPLWRVFFFFFLLSFSPCHLPVISPSRRFAQPMHQFQFCPLRCSITNSMYNGLNRVVHSYVTDCQAVVLGSRKGHLLLSRWGIKHDTKAKQGLCELGHSPMQRWALLVWKWQSFEDDWGSRSTGKPIVIRQVQGQGRISRGQGSGIMVPMTRHKQNHVEMVLMGPWAY